METILIFILFGFVCFGLGVFLGPFVKEAIKTLKP